MLKLNPIKLFVTVEKSEEVLMLQETVKSLSEKCQALETNLKEMKRQRDCLLSDKYTLVNRIEYLTKG